VYVEGQDFARASMAGTKVAVAPSAPPPAAAGAVRRLLMARGTWLVAGLLAGLALGLSIAWTIAVDPQITLGPRTLQAGAAEFPTIAAALAAASPRDTVEIEPGEYAETLTVPGGVQLVARVPGSVTLMAPAVPADAIALTLAEGTGTRISGVRIVGTAQRPFAVGVRLAASGAQVDDVSIEANVGVGMDIVSDGDVTVRTTRFSNVTGIPVRIGPMARPHLERDVFVREPAGRTPAIDVAPEALPQLTENVFVGYPEAVSGDAGHRDQLLRHNHVVGAGAPGARRGNR
jgi:hypothetical protein